MGPKYPNIHLQRDSDTFAMIRRATVAMIDAGVPSATIDQYLKDSLSDDADHALEVTARYVSVQT